MGECPVATSIMTSRFTPSFTDVGTPVSGISEPVFQPQSMYGWVGVFLKSDLIDNGAHQKRWLRGAYRDKITREASGVRGQYSGSANAASVSSTSRSSGVRKAHRWDGG